MKIVILAAGEGKRMRPLTLTTPKPLLRFGDTTCLDSLFQNLPPSIDEAILVVKYLGKQIRAYCGDNFHGRKIRYVEGSLNGNALGFLETRNFFKEGEKFAVSYGDELITREEIEKCLLHPFSWLCYQTDKPKGVGVVMINELNHIVEMVEKPEVPKSNIVADGFMVMDTSIFKYYPPKHENGEYYFSDLMALLTKDKQVKAVLGATNHNQITTPEDLDRMNRIHST